MLTAGRSRPRWISTRHSPNVRPGRIEIEGMGESPHSREEPGPDEQTGADPPEDSRGSSAELIPDLAVVIAVVLLSCLLLAALLR